MKVKYKIQNLKKKMRSDLSDNELEYFEGYTIIPDNLSLTYNKDYVVLGISYSDKCRERLMIMDDSGQRYPNFYPIEFFEIIDKRISRFWKYDRSNEYPILNPVCPSLVSLEEIEEYEFFFDDLIKPIKIVQESFEKKRMAMENEFPDSELSTAEVLSDNWISCSYCGDVWEETSDFGVVACPKNGDRNNNPLWREL